METRSNIPQPAFSEESEKAWLALLLCWVAGFADAFGFLTLNNVFTSQISGNSVALGAHTSQGDWTDAARHGFPILCFSVGFFFGVVFETAVSRLRVRRRFSIALSFEIALLLLFFFFGHNCVHTENIAVEEPAKFFILIALLATAMGIQNASLRRVRRLSVHTTYVTGMVTQSLDSAVKLVFQAYDRLRNRIPETGSEEFLRMLFYGAVWLSFVGGAVCGGLGESHWKFACLLAPLAVLVFIILCDIFRPIHD